MATLKHPKTIINNKSLARQYSDAELFAMGAMYLQDQASRQPTCTCVTKRTPKSCDCLSIFTKLGYDYCLTVARFMVWFARKEKFDQQMLIISWISYSKAENKGRGGRVFIIPQIKTRDDVMRFLDGPVEDQRLQLRLICNSAMLTILGYGQSFWDTLTKHAHDGTQPSHGLAGKSSWNSISDCMVMELHLFFADIEQHAEPTAMRFVRERTGTMHERDTKELKWLPPYFSKRSLYRRYCYEQGWVVSTNSVGSPNKTKEREDDVWIGKSQETRDICSWKTFLRFWANNYATLVVGKPSEDICNACHKYCNLLKYSKRDITPPDEDCDVDSDDEAEPSAVATNKDKDSYTDENNGCVLIVPPDVQANEAIILEAQRHVNDAKVMREYANEKMKEAKESRAVDNWSTAKDCLVADYCQNMALPHQGMTQPGDTYYFSPLTVNCFGTADPSHERPQMKAYVYDEGVARKGANNVASLLYKDINERGWIDDEKGPREQLTVIMDNCGGQNKNKMVIRMFGLLAEIGIYKRINIAFLVTGHTKNVCDRLFNVLKLSYRKTNIYSFGMLLGALNTAPDVEPIRVVEDEFKDWDGFEDKIYTQIASGTVNRMHLFQYDEKEPGVLMKRETAAADSTFERQQMRKRMNAQNRAALVANYKMHLQTLKPPGIAPIKQFELWHKWRPFIPATYQDILCPKPSDAIIKSMKAKSNERSQRAAAKKKATKRQRIDNVNQIDKTSGSVEASSRGDSTQQPQTPIQDVTPQRPMTLDSVTTRLNPDTPS